MVKDSEETFLRRLLPPKSPRDNEYESTVIAIPDFDVTSVASWRDGGSECWLETKLPAIISEPCLMGFEPRVSSTHRFSWHWFVEWGDMLVSEMLRAQDADPQITQRPLFLVAHGLGGLVLKRAVGVIFERFYDPVYRGLIRALSGIILLGCPHPAPNRPRDHERIVTLLKAIRRQSGQSGSEYDEHVSIAATVCQKFSDTSCEVPILTLYETKVSKLSRNIFSLRQVLVDRTLCETTAKRERILGIDSNHYDLCQLNSKSALGTPLEQELTHFLHLAMDLRAINPQRPSLSQRTSRTTALSDLSDVSVRMSSMSIQSTSSRAAAGRTASSNESYIMIPTRSSTTSSTSSLILAYAKAILPCYMLGTRDRDPEFIGREKELAAIDKALSPVASTPEANGRASLKSFAICGIGGLGKSEIAVEYAHSRRNEYDAIFWVRAGDSDRLAEDFSQIAVTLALADTDKLADQVVARNLVLQWLSSPIEQRRDRSSQDLSSSTVKWLLIFDNADSLSDIRDYWPVSSHGSILMTSRDPLAKTKTYFHSPEGMDLGPFTTLESARWLRRLTRSDETLKHIELSEIIAERLSNLPLAVSQVSRAILRQDLSLEEFVELLESEMFRKELYRSEFLGSEKPLWTVFALAKLSPDANILLGILSFLNPDAIPEMVVTGSVRQPGASADQCPLFFKDTISYLEARAELTRASLIRRNIGKKELAIHRIVQDAFMCTTDPETSLSLFRTTLKALTKAWPPADKVEGDTWASERWPRCEELLPHILSMARRYQTNEQLQSVNDFNNEFGILLSQAGTYQAERGLLLEGLAQQTLSQALLEDASTPDHSALTLNHIAQAYVASGRNQGTLALAEGMKAIAYSELLPENENTYQVKGRANYEAAEAHLAARRYEGCYAYYDRALELVSKLPGQDIHMNAYVGIYVGKAHALVQSGDKENISKAWTMMMEILAARERYFHGKPTHRTAVAYFQFGNVLYAQGDLDGALDFYLKFREEYLNVYGPWSIRNAYVLIKLGEVYRLKGELVKAKDSFLEALSILGDNGCHLGEICRTSFFYVEMLEALKDPIAAEARRGAEHALLELSLQVGYTVDVKDLEDHICFWGM